jgi:hypothetical protein
LQLADSSEKREARRTLRPLILGFHPRRAVSTIIGGLIVLSLILTALGTTVFVSQQYDQYQQLVKKTGQYDSQQLSENLVINSPGLTLLTSAAASAWGSGCTTTYNCYNISISNLGGVGVQIATIYINSTGPSGSGCSSPNPQPCILNPTSTIAPYAFNRANQFLNPGEVNHPVVLALPVAVILPDPNPASPQNTILIATSRGNVFSFQWPVPLEIFGQSQSAFSSGTMKVAYQSISGGYSSKNEPGLGGSGGTGYCHEEPLQSYPAASSFAEELTGITGVGVTSNTLYFVNPWITKSILTSITSNDTLLYIYVNVVNTGQTRYVPSAGSIDLTWYSADHLDGTLLGVYYKGTFTAAGGSGPSILPGTSYYAIYDANSLPSKLNNPPGCSSCGGLASVMFWGDASITDGYQSNGETNSPPYFSATVLLPGLWIRSSC